MCHLFKSTCFVLLSLIPELHSQNETTTTETINWDDSPVYTDPRCLPECFFKTNILSRRELELFPQNCTTVCAPHGLHIGEETEFSREELIEIFKNMKHLIGSLYVTRSRYKSCEFLSGLETLDCYNIGSLTVSLNLKMLEIGMTSLTNVSCGIHIGGNYNLTRLNLPKMIPTYSSYANYSSIEVEFYDGPDLCVTIEEMYNMMSNEDIELDRFRRTVGKYCELTRAWKLGGKACDTENITLENQDVGCVNLRGDLIIKEGDEEHVKKLEYVENIFGRLIISGTNLTNTDFLAKLRSVASITKDEPSILVEYNPLLTKVSFPNLKRVLKTIHNPILFNNNSLELMKNPRHCYNILNKLNNDTTWIVKFDGEVCDTIAKRSAEAAAREKSSRKSFYFWIILACLEFIEILK